MLFSTPLADAVRYPRGDLATNRIQRSDLKLDVIRARPSRRHRHSNIRMPPPIARRLLSIINRCWRIRSACLGGRRNNPVSGDADRRRRVDADPAWPHSAPGASSSTILQKKGAGRRAMGAQRGLWEEQRKPLPRYKPRGLHIKAALAIPGLRRRRFPYGRQAGPDGGRERQGGSRPGCCREIG